MSEQEQQKKIIIVCSVCYQIVGDKFPVCHQDVMEENDWVRLYGGFWVFDDTEENRKYLAEKKPPRKVISIRSGPD